MLFVSRFLHAPLKNQTKREKKGRAGHSKKEKKRFFFLYSQTWEIRPPKGLGVSGPIFQVVSFARFCSKNFQNGVAHMPLREP